VVDPVGAVRLVACGGGAAGQLNTIGDANSTLDASGGCGSVAACDQATQDTGIPHRQYIRVVKQADGSWSLNGSICNAVGNAPPHVTPEMVRQEAQRLVPRAAIGLAPKQKTLVNVETIMWVDTPRERDLPIATILGQQVAVHITVTGVAWDYGDDNTDSHGPVGTPYDAKHDPCKTKQCADYYGHTYATTGHMTITATVNWRASFRVGGGPVTAIPGALTGPTAAADVLVREARAVLVPDDPH
jgi:hypothetical protein